jgi:hypothetical protein
VAIYVVRICHSFPVTGYSLRRYQWLDIQIQFVNYVAEKVRNTFLKAKDATSSVLSSVGAILPDNTVKYGKNRKITVFGSERNRKLGGSMAFWRSSSDDTFV